MKNIKDLAPLLGKLIWPIFICILLIIYSEKIEGIYKMVTEGRSLEIAGMFKVGEKIKNSEIKNFAPDDFSVEAIIKDENEINKSSSNKLFQLQDKLRRSKTNSIDILNIRNNKTYDKELLQDYIISLGVNKIVFINNGKFDGWIASSLLLRQLMALNTDNLKYNEIKDFLVGIRTDSVLPSAKTSEVLIKMKENNQNEIAVVKDDTFKYIINRRDILTLLITNSLMSTEDNK